MQRQNPAYEKLRQSAGEAKASPAFFWVVLRGWISSAPAHAAAQNATIEKVGRLREASSGAPLAGFIAIRKQLNTQDTYRWEMGCLDSLEVLDVTGKDHAPMPRGKCQDERVDSQRPFPTLDSYLCEGLTGSASVRERQSFDAYGVQYAFARVRSRPPPLDHNGHRHEEQGHTMLCQIQEQQAARFPALDRNE